MYTVSVSVLSQPMVLPRIDLNQKSFQPTPVEALPKRLLKPSTERACHQSRLQNNNIILKKIKKNASIFYNTELFFYFMSAPTNPLASFFFFSFSYFIAGAMPMSLTWPSSDFSGKILCDFLCHIGPLWKSFGLLTSTSYPRHFMNKMVIISISVDCFFSFLLFLLLFCYDSWARSNGIWSSTGKKLTFLPTLAASVIYLSVLWEYRNEKTENRVICDFDHAMPF